MVLGPEIEYLRMTALDVAGELGLVDELLFAVLAVRKLCEEGNAGLQLQFHLLVFPQESVVLVFKQLRLLHQRGGGLRELLSRVQLVHFLL